MLEHIHDIKDIKSKENNSKHDAYQKVKSIKLKNKRD